MHAAVQEKCMDVDRNAAPSSETQPRGSRMCHLHQEGASLPLTPGQALHTRVNPSASRLQACASDCVRGT